MYQRNKQTSEALSVELSQRTLYGEKQHTRHHSKQRNATTHRTPHATSLKEFGIIGIEVCNKRVATMRQHHQKTSYDAQKIHPRNVFSYIRIHNIRFRFKSRTKIIVFGEIKKREGEIKKRADVSIKTSARFLCVEKD